MNRKLLQLLIGAAFMLVGATGLGQPEKATHAVQCHEYMGNTSWTVQTCIAGKECMPSQDALPVHKGRAGMACAILKNGLPDIKEKPGKMTCNEGKHISPYIKSVDQYYSKYFDALCNATKPHEGRE